MNYKQLEAFRAFMITGSTIEAANRLGLSQSAVSRLLSQFEADLGIALFLRRKGRLHPTEQAEALLPDAEHMLAGANGFHRHVNQLRLGGPRRTLIRVQMPTTIAHLIMPGVARAFMADHPEAVLEVFSGAYEHGELSVLGREVDMSLLRIPTQNHGLDVTPFMSTEAVCILPTGHPLLRLKEIAAGDLEDTDLVLLGRQRPLRHDIDMAFRHARVRPRIRAEVHSVDMACRFVAQGLGVSIVNGLLASLNRDLPIERRPFRPAIEYRFGIATLQGQPAHPLVPALSARIIDALKAAAGADTYRVITPDAEANLLGHGSASGVHQPAAPSPTAP
ncbi:MULTISPECIES: LysR family transcriptional regulator [unclassified Achromobacter]|uniref:LysR family transcriptional regulator n=1 Tax=unclassified Achromobacter TaxID=2626865 RepID=UPI000B51788E|nr:MULTISPECIES: LysR family transcriptional regulator [unclassified Achromobacter]OWT77007.1 LysR family transcriptional regulator [Achromobacter sp. HZ28]OWT77887.1 LysR family transcriptional regulator [Achromobacter sp. HZ34]